MRNQGYFVALVMACVAGFPSSALAQQFVVSNSTHRYDQYAVFGNGNNVATSLAGASTVLVNGQEDLNTSATPTYPNETINKEMWVAFTSDASQWFEAGDIAPIDGAGNPYRGHFWAEMQCATSPSCEFDQYVTGAQNPTGAHTFEISYDAQNGTWDLYIDNAFVTGSPDFPSFNSLYDIQIGVEDTAQAFSFTYGTYFDYVQYQDVNGAWHDWSDDGETTADYSNAPSNWSAVYDATPGENTVALYN